MSLRTIEYTTNTYKKYLYTFRINQVILTYGERKKERPNFYRMFSQNLSISAAFTAILKMKLPQWKAIGVCTPPVVNCTAGYGYGYVQWSVHWAPSQTTWVLVLAGARHCALKTCGKKNANSAFRLG